MIVDVRMPGLNGIDFQKALIERGRQEQLIFITGHANVPMCAEAMKAGAVDFLPKPFKPKRIVGKRRTRLESLDRTTPSRGAEESSPRAT